MRHKDVKDPSIILNAITQNVGWRLRHDQTILVKGDLATPAARIKGAIKAVRALGA